MRRPYIYRQVCQDKTHTPSVLLRMALIVFLSVLASLTATAQLRMDDDGNYIIATKADYMTLVSNKFYWSEGRSFVQIFDIDLEGSVVTPIGDIDHPFTGIYDGAGHTISNGTMYWDRPSYLNFGLFGYLYGLPPEDKYATVKNLNVRDFTITRSNQAEEMMENGNIDTKIGILVGLMGEYINVHDISISKCTIDDGGQPAAVRNIMVGGAIGDLYKSKAQESGGIDTPGFVFKNIYVNVDIDLTNTVKTSTNHQYFVGGIIGRIRTPKDPSYVPDNTVFTGKIVAPHGSVSPTVGNIRSGDGAGYDNLIYSYAGWFAGKKMLSQVLTGDAYDNFVKTRRYYNYQVYNSKAHEVQTVDDTNPTPSAKYAYRTRTFTPNGKDNVTPVAFPTKDVDNNKFEDNWALVQGVNFGTHSPLDTKGDEMLAMLYNACVDTERCHWVRGDGVTKADFYLVPDHELDFVKAYIETDNTKTPPVYRAKLGYKGGGIEYPGIETGSIQWQVTNSVKDGTWEDLEGATDLIEIPFNMTSFYRFKWTKGDIELVSGYMAPTRTVYVFNHDTNDEYNETLYNVDKFNYPKDAKYAQAGDDGWNGERPEHAVKTMKRAFQLLDEYGDMYSNKIVVMGYYRDEDFLASYVSDGLYAKPTTITGVEDSEGISGGIMGFSRLQSGPLQSGGSDLFLYFQAPLRLDNIGIMRHWTNDNKGELSANPPSGQSFFVCNYFDFTVDDNVRFINFPAMHSGYGMPENLNTVPYISIVGGNQDSNADAVESPIEYPSQRYPDKPGFYSTPELTVINLRSGVFGRIICCGRNAGENMLSGNISGSPDVPNRIRLNVNITNDIDLSKDAKGNSKSLSSKYGYKLTKDKNTGKLRPETGAGYSHNIGLISGGQTDGSCYGDVIMNIYAGHIARIITSNITYGRVVDDRHPSDSFWGRAILNIYGNTDVAADGTVSSQTTINEVFGGMLGRIGDANSECYPYFYGQSVINMYGGFIGAYTGTRKDNASLNKLKDLNPNLYGVGSGGVTGLGHDEYHTTDPLIPYYGADNKLYYGDYDAVKASGFSMPVMTMYDGKKVDLAKTACEVNLYSGYIQGSVYGGGYGYSNEIPTGDTDKPFTLAPEDIGVLYGDSKVTMHRHPEYQPPVVLGNVYGGGAGSSNYAEGYRKEYPDLYAANPDRFRKVASQYGNTQVLISDGVIGNASKSTGGDVYAGSQGIPDYPDIAALYGSTSLVINGGTIYGNIYGGSETANIWSHADIPNSGNTNVTINGGTIGNNIFGGSKGIDAGKTDNTGDTKALIAGSTNVTVNGGDFLPWPYIDLNASPADNIDIVNNRDKFRTFNIYGGGYMNCDVSGDANLNVYSSLLSNEASFVPPTQNPNALDEHTVSNYQSAYMDITYRNFCVYGGGFGEKTNVLNANVYVTIPRDRAHVSQPHGKTLDRFLDHQSFFDIAGGGYSGDVGYWATPQVDKANEKITIKKITPDDGYTYVHINGVSTGIKSNTRINNAAELRAGVKKALGLSDVDEADLTDAQKDLVNTWLVKMYDHYEGGACRVTIDDYTFARKVMGGGFYGSCLTTDTHVRCGSLRQVYGGSLLGYVHIRAQLQFGNRPEDFVWWDTKTNAYVFSEDGKADGLEAFHGDFDETKKNYPDVWTQAEAFAKELNDYIFITENIYGGNDVKGIIGTKRYEAPYTFAAGDYGVTRGLAKAGDPVYCVDETDGGPLYCTDIDPSEQKGILFAIYGGTFMGDVYSAGNGHYRGYFVPEWVRYNDGPARMYRTMISSVQDETKPGIEYAKAYRSRPMVGAVNVNLRGNSADDYIKLRGNFFGGGRECTIGQFNTILPLEDPRRLVQGGFLHVNFGGFVHVDGNVYMGAEGRQYADQQCVPAGENIDLKTFNGSTTKELARLGDAAYDHWYYDTDQECYMPGYPAPGKVDGNFGLKGEHMLGSYMQNVQMQGDVELTFYRYLYERDPDTHEYKHDAVGNKVRKRWHPGEIAIDEYDSEDVEMRSFFLGGLSGSMTNNTIMRYTYPAEYDDSGAKVRDEYTEKWGTIYRITLPRGVTVHDKVVMGSENAFINYYPYTDRTCTAMDKSAPMYTYEGGLITQHTFSYDLVLYNFLNRNKANPEPEDLLTKHSLPDDFYKDTTNELYNQVKNSTSYTVRDENGNDVTIKRRRYAAGDNTSVLNNNIIRSHNYIMDSPRYDLAWYADGSQAYIGPREARAISDDRTTVTKLTAVCQFEPLAAQIQGAGSSPSLDDHNYHYGGLVYGGCYNSGIVMGDVVMNIGSNLIGSHLDDAMNDQIADFASLRHNIGRVFGGGFGPQTKIEGDTYVNLLRNFTGMNIFGGGMEGDVTGTAHVTYIGTEQNSYVFGAIYGGGLRGNVGTPQVTQKATEVRLFSGNVEEVYGGSCMGNLYGRAFVELCDEVLDELDHLDLSRINRDNWGGNRLIAGKVFGGNDVAGTITKPDHGAFVTDPTDIMFEGFTTGVYVHEIQGEEETNSGSGSGSGSGSTPTPSHSPEDVGPGKTSPGSNNGYNGFPLIGDLFGGSNGDYGVQGPKKYISGQVEIATGDSIDTKTIDLEGMDVPHIGYSHIVINGGTVINAYGGGDMCDITDANKITVDYPAKTVTKVDGKDVVDMGATLARAGFETKDELDRVWSVLHFSSDQQKDEVTETDAEGHPIFTYQIHRLFGGNNNADMAIQPDWEELKSGYIGSLYSGGNFGKMTYYQAKIEADPSQGIEAQDEKGLTLDVNSPNLIINNVYGGGRVGDIDPDVPTGTTPAKTFYGATLNIRQGVIDHVYGGNDVSGYVRFGTNVNLYGAISGDVYCAGNGNYLYKYDRTGLTEIDGEPAFKYEFDNDNKLITDRLKIREDYAFKTDTYKGARYFLLPAKADYGFTKANYDGNNYDATDAETVMAINSYRPHVERAKIYIEGQDENNRVWVRGNVYCGGNSAAVVPSNTGILPVSGSDYDVEFKIGSHVILNGVFLGSNGAGLADGQMIANTERLNAVGETNLKMTADVPDEGASNAMRLSNPIDASAKDKTLYPKVLDLYMRAVETTQAPDNFKLDPSITDAYIGEFCVGGNRGSMMTDKCITLDFPESLTIFGRIIGGCKNANVTYNGVTHIGGLTVPLASQQTKVDISVHSRFEPLALMYPDPDADPGISMYYYMVDADGKEIPRDQQASYTGKKLYMNQQCNIFGGCYTSGRTVGDIHLDIYSDMINYKLIDDAYGDDEPLPVDNPKFIDQQALINGMTDARSWRAFTVVGGGYGADTEVWGNIDVRMLPTVKGEGSDRTVSHPSVASLFGGSQEGLIVGNTNVEIRDGKVLANVYGASEAAKMYGSTSVIVGYPRYYRAKVTGNYRINRADYMSDVAINDRRDAFDEVVVPKTVAYRDGDIVPQNVYEMMIGRVKDSRIKTVIYDSPNPDFRVGKTVDDDNVDVFGDTYPISDYFEPVKSLTLGEDDKPVRDHITPADFDASWNDIVIWIGDQYANINPQKPYYGQGNIYGGGYIPNSTDRTLIGQPTIMRYTPVYNLGLVDLDPGLTSAMTDDAKLALRQLFTKLYGGNTAVLIWDNEDNAILADDDDLLKDHIHIGTGYFRKVEVTANSSAKGLYKKLGDKDAYIYQTIGKVDSDPVSLNSYYEKVADGGVYGGGRKVFAQAFRSIDLAYYGYAEHSPQRPKLLNTIQRADVATITDCCMELVGASDFTLNNFNNVYYAINRVGELRMYSSLDPTQELAAATDGDTDDGVQLHNVNRSRNYVALYNCTNQLGAFRSNWTFEKLYHDPNGKRAGVEGDGYDNTNSYPTTPDGEVSYVNRKHRYIDVYDLYHKLLLKDDAYNNAVDKDGVPKVTAADITDLGKLYKACAGKEMETGTAEEGASLLTPTVKKAVEDLFSQRNVGTSGNMLGISSGYSLSFEGKARQPEHHPAGTAEADMPETTYYGPAYGVTEIKLLTSVSGMGGGYVYALNHHYDKTIDGSQAGVETEGWCSKFGRDFLQTTGNFVFPGASYNTIKDGKKQESHNFIIDDCYDHYDPVNHGFYGCLDDPTDHDRVFEKDYAPALRAAAKGYDIDINRKHEIHYWYVSGNTYVYNVTITGITSDTSPEQPRSFWVDNSKGMLNLFNVKEGTTIEVTDVTWFEHEDKQEGDPDTCDLTRHETAGEGTDKYEYLDTQYGLYLTVDHDTRNNYTDTEAHPGAYVIRIPRHAYKMRDDGETHDPVNVKQEYFDRAFTDLEHAVKVNPNDVHPGITNAYLDKYETVDGEGATVEADNHPRLGVRLVDGQRNRLADEEPQVGIDYYNNHLKGDHNVQVTLRTYNGDSDPIIYIINIDIRYLMGPAIYGQIDIENCALPGEYIYANADNVEVLMDENLGVSEQKWRLYPNDDNGNRISKTVAAANGCDLPGMNPSDTNPVIFFDNDNNAYYKLESEEFTTKSEKLIHIPAYYYQNGWEVVYCVRANGEDFVSSLPYYIQEPNAEGVLEDTEVPNLANRLQVHNYHRMRPVLDDKIIDLRLTPGSRTYIEGPEVLTFADIDKVSQENDMKYFFEYLSAMQYDGRTLPTHMPTFAHFTTPDGHVVNPQYGAGLDFYQQGRYAVPVKSKFTNTEANPLYFTGSYHGNGHRMLIPKEASIYMVNGYGKKDDSVTPIPGYMYNTGFVSEVANDETTIYDENYGVITNCFYFNKDGKGMLTKTGTLRNCYQNTDVPTNAAKEPLFKYNQLLKLSTEGFRYGQAAYNLNGFYLQKRHILLHKEVPDANTDVAAEWHPGAANNPWALGMRDKELRRMKPDATTDPYMDDFAVKYIEDMFNNGDYRYAFYNLPDGFTQFTEALRTADEPNYFDRLSYRGVDGKTVSAHDATPDPDGKGSDGHKADMQRWCENHQEYHPLFDKDYLFFGENLTVDAEHQDFLPEAYTPANRVYRVGGFYGSAADKGYFMNRVAYLDAPKITAIDFVGYRDRDLYEPDNSLGGLSYGKNGAHGKLKTTAFDPHGDDGWIIDPGRHEVYMPPTLDLPWTWTADDGSDLKHDFSEFDVNSDKVTHNLLIYTEDLPEAHDVMSAFHYVGEDYALRTNPTASAKAQHADAGIRAHHIVDYGPEDVKDDNDVVIGQQTTTPRVYDDLMHLVDLHDFNAPVAFSATDAWYNRKPAAYAAPYTMEKNGVEKAYTSAWEGICLPFDAMKVYAASTNPTEMRDMGEITHFFGEDADHGGDDWKGHEYWLRRLVAVDDTDGDELVFERPREANRGTYKNASNVDTPYYERVEDYTYTNTAIYDLYKDLEYDVPNVPDYTHDKLYHTPDAQHLRLIKGYRYLSHNMPYVVTYPGEQYYEFDLSGKFYAQKVMDASSDNIVVTPVPQTICYMANGGAREQVTIPVTDETPMAEYTYGGYTMRGTFMHVTDDADLAKSVLYQEVENLAVLDGMKASEHSVTLAGSDPSSMLHNSTSFKAHKEKMVVPPFRTYVTSSAPIKTSAPMIIGSRGAAMPEEVIEDDEPVDIPGYDESEKAVRVWVEGRKLVIETPYDLETNIYNVSGQLVRRIKAYEGVNRYSGLPAGYYVVLRTKVAIGN